MNKTVYLLLLVVFAGYHFSAYGQKTLDFDTITVRSTNIPLKISETGRNISVLTSADLARLPATSLEDALQYLPGIEVQSRNAFGAQGDILMRGSTFTQVLVLIDGMRLNDPLTAHFNNYMPVSTAEIERIEVLRGPAAAMYGPDAVGGVINVITKTFSPQQSEGTTGLVSLQAGEHGLLQGELGVHHQGDRFGISASANRSAADGETIPARTTDAAMLDPYDNFFNINTAAIGLRYQLNDNWRLGWRTAYDYRDFAARYFYTVSTFDKSEETVTNLWNHFQIAKTGNNNALDINLGYKRNTDEFVFSPDFPSTNEHTTQLLNLTANYLHSLSTTFSVKTGLQIDRRQIESNDRGDHEDTHFGVYAMGLYQPNAQVNLTASLRGDYDENYEFELSPQVNFSYVLDQVTLRAAVGRSIRAADYTERFVSNNLSNLSPGRNLGNPFLEAERSWSQELGLDVAVRKNWQIKATGFLRQSDNLIDYVVTNESKINGIGDLQTDANYNFAQNISSVNTNGFEVENWLRFPLSERWQANWSMGYTYVNTSNEDDVLSIYLSSHARHLWTTQFQAYNDRFELGLSGRFKDRNPRAAEAIGQRVDASYQVWNFRARATVWNGLGVTATVHNLFDAAYQDILGAPMPGRWIMGGVSWRME